MDGRRIIQIAIGDQIAIGEASVTGLNCLFAVCEDGTLWQLNGKTWKQHPNPPPAGRFTVGKPVDFIANGR